MKLIWSVFLHFPKLWVIVDLFPYLTFPGRVSNATSAYLTKYLAHPIRDVIILSLDVLKKLDRLTMIWNV